MRPAVQRALCQAGSGLQSRGQPALPRWSAALLGQRPASASATSRPLCLPLGSTAPGSRPAFSACSGGIAVPSRSGPAEMTSSAQYALEHARTHFLPAIGTLFSTLRLTAFRLPFRVVATQSHRWANSRHVTRGQRASQCVRVPAFAMTSGEGVPSKSVMSSSWCTTFLPGNRGLPSRISAKMQPMDQMSIAVEYFAKKDPHSSGARYLRDNAFLSSLAYYSWNQGGVWP